MARFWLGLFCLLFAAMCGFTAVGFGLTAILPNSPSLNPIFPTIFAVVALCAALALWTSELRRTEGDDLFTGRRGLLVAMMVITSLVIFGLTIAMLLNRDAWRGFFEGLRG